MKEQIKKIQQTNTLAELEEIRIALLGKKGILTARFAELKTCNAEEKKTLAQELNTLKQEVERNLAIQKEVLELKELESRLKAEKIDVSLFNVANTKGANHPVMLMLDRIVEYFLSMNFSLNMGPLVEDDFHNFEALNLPKYHPARDMQDTFYFNDGKLLRTHTSPVQIRTMQEQKPPIRMIAPGSVFRCDYDITHTPMFHQVEGLVVENGKDSISFANLKFILEDFLKFMFGDVKVRYRSSFFPFTEPSAEVDMSCIFCGGSGCRVCSHTGWLEVLGCGSVDVNVFNAVGYENVSGYAFGLGVERFAMLYYSVPDLRAFFESNLKVLEQFR